MKFYYVDLDEIKKDIVVELCKQNRIFFTLKSNCFVTSVFSFSSQVEKEYTVIIDTDYEHKMFLDYLLEKEFKKLDKHAETIQSLERCLYSQNSDFVPCNGATFSMSEYPKLFINGRELKPISEIDIKNTKYTLWEKFKKRKNDKEK